ncbi:hypothetical protein ACKWTF_001522 [Chironomus riparius]
MWVQYFLLLLTNLVITINARTYVIIDEKIEKCVVEGYDPNFEIYDISGLKIIPENDTHTFINGKMIQRVEVKSPWALHVHMEHYDRGEWLLQAFSKNFTDFCPEFKSPIQPWYYATKHLKGCPTPVGHVHEFNMIPLELSEYLLKAIPPHYMGKWRSVIHRGMKVNGVDQLECLRVYAHVYIE